MSEPSNNDELLPDFLAESLDLIEKAHQDIASMRAGGERGEALNSVFRAVHTIKGGAAIFEFKNTKAIAHKLETLLDARRKAPERLNDAELGSMAKVIDRLEDLLRNHDRLGAGTSIAEASASVGDAVLAALSSELTAVAAESVTPAESASLVPEAAAPVVPFVSVPKAGAPELLRVPVERVQRNLDVVSEIFLIRNQMTYLVDRLFASTPVDHGFVQAWEALDNSLRRSIGELESVAMSMRMMPLGGLFARMDKTVRAYVDGSGKKIRVEKSGESTELDKKVIDSLGEPLIHLIRNAMDHGIEASDARLAAGKPEEGTIRLDAKVVGNEVVLTIGDDGKGIDGKRVKAAAEAKGLDVSSVNDERSAVELIFVPGFSTVAAVTETSGRGVGMDVVKSAVERLGGTIQVQTEPGEGTSFVIRLPLSMSVIPAIIVRLNGQLFSLGTGDIIETQRVSARDLQINGGSTYVKYRGEYIPCHDLERYINTPEVDERGYQASVFVCVVRYQAGYVALRVGALESNTEIVAKPMPAYAPKIPYVTGISVLPTGQPVFVLSLSRFCRERIENEGGAYETSSEAA